MPFITDIGRKTRQEIVRCWLRMEDYYELGGLPRALGRLVYEQYINTLNELFENLIIDRLPATCGALLGPVSDADDIPDVDVSYSELYTAAEESNNGLAWAVIEHCGSTWAGSDIIPDEALLYLLETTSPCLEDLELIEEEFLAEWRKLHTDISHISVSPRLAHITLWTNRL